MRYGSITLVRRCSIECRAPDEALDYEDGLAGWWEWELAFTGHLEARMEERGFSEIDLRSMLDVTTRLRSAHGARWLVETRHKEVSWVVVVEPDEEDQVLVVITAYPVDNSS